VLEEAGLDAEIESRVLEEFEMEEEIFKDSSGPFKLSFLVRLFEDVDDDILGVKPGFAVRKRAWWAELGWKEAYKLFVKEGSEEGGVGELGGLGGPDTGNGMQLMASLFKCDPRREFFAAIFRGKRGVGCCVETWIWTGTELETTELKSTCSSTCIEPMDRDGASALLNVKEALFCDWERTADAETWAKDNVQVGGDFWYWRAGEEETLEYEVIGVDATVLPNARTAQSRKLHYKGTESLNLDVPQLSEVYTV
jgi:hypothetical protein